MSSEMPAASAPFSFIPSSIRREINDSFADSATKPVNRDSKPEWMKAYDDETVDFVRYLLVARHVIAGTPVPAVGSPEEWDGVTHEFFESIVKYIANEAKELAEGALFGGGGSEGREEHAGGWGNEDELYREFEWQEGLQDDSDSDRSTVRGDSPSSIREPQEEDESAEGRKDDYDSDDVTDRLSILSTLAVDGSP